jgi:hypothetical protein
MDGFNAQELGYKGPPVSANDAIEEANYMYAKMYREEMEAGREIPVVDIPASLGADAIYSVEAGDKMIREANKRHYSLSALGRRNWDRIFRRDK